MDNIQTYITEQVRQQIERLLGEIRRYIVTQIRMRLMWLLLLPLMFIGLVVGGIAAGLGLAWFLRRRTQQRRTTTTSKPRESKPAADKPVELPPAPIVVTPAEKPAPAKPKPAKTEAAEADDLTKVNGLGPKSATVLNAAGVTTFAALAKLTPEALKELLTGGGMTRLLNYETWPQQAALAAKGDWDGLAALNEQLRAA